MRNLLLAPLLFLLSCCTPQAPQAQVAPTSDSSKPQPAMSTAHAQTETLVLAGGCFWCVEGVYRQLKGVTDAKSGYAGGTKETANYAAVCSHETKHAEAVQLTFDPAVCPAERIYEVFFTIAHDPTQLNAQGQDHGTQYRSAIFFADDAQKAEAQKEIAKFQPLFGGKITTTLEDLRLTPFYPAEDYHQDYVGQYNAGIPVQNSGYLECTALPKIDKLRAKHPEWCK